MDRSEIERRLEMLKKELAKKEKKLIKYERHSKRKAHVQQKMKEHNHLYSGATTTEHSDTSCSACPVDREKETDFNIRPNSEKHSLVKFCLGSDDTASESDGAVGSVPRSKLPASKTVAVCGDVVADNSLKTNVAEIASPGTPQALDSLCSGYVTSGDAGIKHSGTLKRRTKRGRLSLNHRPSPVTSLSDPPAPFMPNTTSLVAAEQVSKHHSQDTAENKQSEKILIENDKAVPNITLTESRDQGSCSLKEDTDCVASGSSCDGSTRSDNTSLNTAGHGDVTAAADGGGDSTGLCLQASSSVNTISIVNIYADSGANSVTSENMNHDNDTESSKRKTRSRKKRQPDADIIDWSYLENANGDMYSQVKSRSRRKSLPPVINHLEFEESISQSKKRQSSRKRKSVGSFAFPAVSDGLSQLTSDDKSSQTCEGQVCDSNLDSPVTQVFPSLKTWTKSLILEQVIDFCLPRDDFSQLLDEKILSGGDVELSQQPSLVDSFPDSSVKSDSQYNDSVENVKKPSRRIRKGLKCHVKRTQKGIKSPNKSSNESSSTAQPSDNKLCQQSSTFAVKEVVSMDCMLCEDGVYMVVMTTTRSLGLWQVKGKSTTQVLLHTPNTTDDQEKIHSVCFVPWRRKREFYDLCLATKKLDMMRVLVLSVSIWAAEMNPLPVTSSCSPGVNDIPVTCIDRVNPEFIFIVLPLLLSDSCCLLVTCPGDGQNTEVARHHLSQEDSVTVTQQKELPSCNDAILSLIEIEHQPCAVLGAAHYAIYIWNVEESLLLLTLSVQFPLVVCPRAVSTHGYVFVVAVLEGQTEALSTNSVLAIEPVSSKYAMLKQPPSVHPPGTVTQPTPVKGV